MIGKDANGVEYTEREYCMEISMQTLVKKNQEQLIEIARADGSVALLREKLKHANKKARRLEWELSVMTKYIEENKLELPDIPDMPDRSTWTETVDLPAPEEPPDEPAPRKRQQKDDE